MAKLKKYHQMQHSMADNSVIVFSGSGLTIGKMQTKGKVLANDFEYFFPRISLIIYLGVDNCQRS